MSPTKASWCSWASPRASARSQSFSTAVRPLNRGVPPRVDRYGAEESVTVSVTLFEPPLPSVTLTSPMESEAGWLSPP